MKKQKQIKLENFLNKEEISYLKRWDDDYRVPKGKDFPQHSILFGLIDKGIIFTKESFLIRPPKTWCKLTGFGYWALSIILPGNTIEKDSEKLLTFFT